MRKTTATLLRVVQILAVRLLRLLVLGFVIIGILAGAGYAWLAQNILPTLPEDLSQLRDWRPLTSCRVFDANNNQVDQFYIERRIWVPIAELPPIVWQAFMASEDRRFMGHEGVDTIGVARAFVVNLTSGSISQGGSTITQQLVKNLLVGKERSYERKLKEAILALRLERTLTKMEILELYVNYVFLGSGNYGVEAAARDYFGVSARDLDAGQAALLAGLVPAPSHYSPRYNPEAAMARRGHVLRAMVRDSYLTAEEADLYKGDPVHVVVSGGRTGPMEDLDVAYVTAVRREVRRLFGPDLPFQAGLHVHTPLLPEVQEAAVLAIRDALKGLDDRQGRRGAIRHLEPPSWHGFLMRADGFDRDRNSGAIVAPEVGDCFQALVGEGGLNDVRAGPFTFSLSATDRLLKVRHRSAERAATTLQAQLGPGDVFRSCLTAPGIVGLDPRPWGEGAAVVLDNATGGVVALVGGYAPTLEGYIRATQARRQPGSSFKPYVYAAALLGGATQLDIVHDAPLSLPGTNGRMWSPKNYNGEYFGALPMRNALAKSLNTVSVRLVLEQGADRVAGLARAMGVATPLRTDLTLALGSSEVTPLDQAVGYATIARMGVPTDPVFITRLVDVNGKEIGHAGQEVRVSRKAVATLPGGPKPRALPSGVAYELADMMREVVRAGTARKASRKGFDRAGKTGTTNGFQDAWFVGFTPRYTAAVWIGSDTISALGDSETGGRAALPAWIRIVESTDQPEGERFPIPEDAILVPHGDGLWVGLPRGRVPASTLGLTALWDAPLPEPVAPVAPSPEQAPIISASAEPLPLPEGPSGEGPVD